jgi:DNA processing protein
LLKRGKEDLKWCEKRNIRVISQWDPDYPPQLREIYDPPLILYARGELPDPAAPLISIVGTRRPTGTGIKSSYRLALELALNGVPVVSGLARGIDGAAHRGALAGGGTTFGVLGCGIDTIYPAEHKSLAGKILESGGGILSEYPPGEPPTKYRFPERNRIISGLARTVVLGQCPEKSGALITANYALDQGRDLLVLRDGTEGGMGKGGRNLIEEGARVVSGAAEVLEEWGTLPVSSLEGVTEWKGRSPAGEMAERLELELSGELIRIMGMEYLCR